MLIFSAVVLVAGAVLYTLMVRREDLPAPEPVSPAAHLEERQAAIYESLRDLQFEYRAGKLSDQDYQQTKADLQGELARLLAEIERLRPAAEKPGTRPEKPRTAPERAGVACPHCGATFAQPLKFCGECGRPMAGGGA